MFIGDGIGILIFLALAVLAVPLGVILLFVRQQAMAREIAALRAELAVLNSRLSARAAGPSSDPPPTGADAAPALPPV
ncbi:MAG: hypothetical protein RIR62_2249, partial [Pseudomonadota bacterium]